jgi:hypothetical protein
MGKSKATQRIERIMTKLMMEGKLDKPKPKVRTPKQVVQRPTESIDCCVGKLSRLPDGVVPCPDCPLD